MKSIHYLMYKFIALMILSLGVLTAGDPEIKKNDPAPHPIIVNNLDGFDNVAKSCQRFFSVSKDTDALTVGSAFEKLFTIEDVIKTLKYVQVIHEEDLDYIAKGHKQQNGSPWEFRLGQFWFLKANFEFYKIYGNTWDAKQNKVPLPYGKIKLTKYALFEIPVSNQKSWRNDTEIYALPEWVNPKSGLPQYRIRFSKQDIFNGVYRSGGIADGKALPLAYTTRSHFENVMLQGTFFGKFPDGTVRIFGSAGNNEVPFNSKIKLSKQKRYIYFKNQDELLGYGKTKEDKITIRQEITFAGDAKIFGLGKLMMTQYVDTKTKKVSARIGMMADTGSAFDDNSYHIDYLLGTFDSTKEFYAESSKIPEFCEAFVLIKK